MKNCLQIEIWFEPRTCVILSLKTEKSVEKKVEKDRHHVQNVEEYLIDSHDGEDGDGVLREGIQAGFVQEETRPLRA